MWTALGLQIENYKQSLTGHPSRSLEDGTESNMDLEDPAQGVLEEKNISNGAREHTCDILAKNAAVFCPSVNLPGE